jgi:hypothetical protein
VVAREHGVPQDGGEGVQQGARDAAEGRGGEGAREEAERSAEVG